MKSIIKSLLDGFFPRLCYGCENQPLTKGDYFCLACTHACPITPYHKQSENPAMDRIGGRAKFAHGSSMFRFYGGGRVQNMIHSMKYRGLWKAGQELGAHYGMQLLASESLFASTLTVVPVPLHRNRLRSRGYNQSECFGEGLCASTGWDLALNCLLRIRDTPSQTAMSREARQSNLLDAFDLRSSELLKGKDVLLIDDILTTGATLEACYPVVLSANVRSISFCTIGLAF